MSAAEIIAALVILLFYCTVIRSSIFKIHHKEWKIPENSLNLQVTSYLLTGTGLSVGDVS